MKVFALETNKDKIIEHFCSEDEEVLLLTYYHGLSYLFAIVREIIVTIVLVALAVTAVIMELPLFWIFAILSLLWVIFVFFNTLKAFIDWRFDFILVTTDKVVVVDQTSFLKHEIRPIHLENIGSVTTRTQYWNIFNFGIIALNLKEGLGGEDEKLSYVPNAESVAGKIADAVTRYQRRKYQR